MGKEWKDYLQLKKERPELFKCTPAHPIIFDETKVSAFEQESGRTIGVVYSSPYNKLIVDLVLLDGKYCAYERVIPAFEGGVVIVPLCEDKIVMLEQWRHATRSLSYQLPRGFGTPALSARDNVVKEITEELNIDSSKVSCVAHIGDVEPDNGLTSNCVEVYKCQVAAVPDRNAHEGIKSIKLLTLEDLRANIRCGMIKDSFTLSALAFL